jgi:hypothetical protein
VQLFSVGTGHLPTGCGSDGILHAGHPSIREFIMKFLKLSPIFMIAGLLVAAPAFAQTSTPEKQKTDGNGPPMVGPASKAFKQSTDGDGPPMVGPASKAYKQSTDGDGPPMVGPASKAYKASN